MGSSLIASPGSVSALAWSCSPAAATPRAVRTLLSRTGLRSPRRRDVHQIGKLFLPEQGVCQHGQVIRLVAIVLPRGARLALGQLGVAELQIRLSQTCSQNGILRRFADRVAQFDFSGLEISLCVY